MYKDPSEFRERFKAYKEGKSVREIYGLPGYAGGKATPLDDTLEFLKLYEGFKDTTYLDGNGIPTIGYGFTDSALVNKGKITRAEADTRLRQEVLKREAVLSRMKNWDKLSEESKTALRSYYYNYPAGFKDTTKFMKYWNSGLYSKAIKEVDAGMYDEKNPGLRTRRLAEQALLRNDPFLMLRTPVVSEKPRDVTVQYPDVTRVATTIPQEKVIDYTDRRNAVMAEAERAFEVHKAIQDMYGMSYNTPVWKPIELDVTPFKTYGDGKISLGHKQIPIDKARAWAMHHDADEPWYERYGKNVADAVLGTIETFTEPYRNAVNGRMSADDVLSIGLDLGAGIGAKAIRKASKMVKPTKASVSLKGKSPREVGRYFEENPELTTEPNAQKLAEATEFIKQDALPRVKLAAKKKGKSVDFDPNSVTFKEADFKDSKLGGVSTPNKTVYMRAGSPTNHYVHELAHEMRRMTGETPEEASRLFTTYKNSGKFIKDHPEFMLLAEDEAINTELRYLVSHANGGAKGKALDKIIDNISYDLFETYAILANAYTNDMAMSKGINKDTFKNTLKYVGVGVPGISSVNRENWFNNGKLPGYSNGKIRIKPSKRGTFTAAAKKHGASVREFESRVLKNPEKYSKAMVKKARFSRNARSWKH